MVFGGLCGGRVIAMQGSCAPCLASFVCFIVAGDVCLDFWPFFLVMMVILSEEFLMMRMMVLSGVCLGG